MKAMILSAGYGTRFRPVTYSMPKPLVPLCNRPLIGWVLESLLEFGVGDVVVNLHHLPEMLRSWLDKEYGQRCRLHYSLETTILGTGGGLLKCRAHFEGEDVFLVVNGDTVQFPPFARLLDALMLAGSPAAMLLRRPPESDRFTGVWLDGDRVSAIGVSGTGRSLMFSGVHAMTPEVFRHLPDRDVSGLTEDLYAPMLESGLGVGAAVDDGLWFDVGTPARYLAASLGLLDAITSGRVKAPSGSLVQPLQQVLVASSAVVEAQVLRSSVGGNSIVGRGGQLVDSSVWRDARIGDGSLVEGSIVADGVFLPAGSEVRNALVCRKTDVVPSDESVELIEDHCFVPVDPAERATVRFGGGT
jgi:NDP-sugar pyrophosphorylase family protein